MGYKAMLYDPPTVLRWMNVDDKDDEIEKWKSFIPALRVLLSQLHKAVMNASDEDVVKVAKAIAKSQRVEFDFKINGQIAKGVINPDKNDNVRIAIAGIVAGVIASNIVDRSKTIATGLNMQISLSQPEPFTRYTGSYKKKRKNIFRDYIDKLQSRVQKKEFKKASDFEYRVSSEIKNTYNQGKSLIKQLKEKVENIIDTAKQTIKNVFGKAKNFFRVLER